MSYRTEYRLSVPEDGPTTGEVAAKLAQKVPHDHALTCPRGEQEDFWDSVITGCLPWNWEYNEADMKTISAYWPDIVFTLTGVGEDPGDQWVKYFKDRRVQAESQPNWRPPTFHPGRLR